MGADSSTLQSIESLNTTLEDIEKKLFVIEDVHLHHERTIAHDDSVLISGKKIGCRSGVRLVCGPILGAVSSNFARMLVEVDYDAELTFNVFVSDAKLMCSRYNFTVTLSAKGGQPIATKIDNLLPGSNYVIYIGGITPAETATNYASFQTLPEEARAVRILLAYNGRVDRLMPGETNLWKEIENRVITPHVSQPAYCKPVGEEENDETDHLYLSSSVNPHNATNAQPTTPCVPPVHLLCHHGNLISVEPIIRCRAVELLDLLVREDSNFEDWVTILEQTEALIREAFRAALAAPALARTLRRCGNLFLVGPEEAGAMTTALLALNLPEKLASRPFNYDKDTDGTVSDTRAPTSHKNSSSTLHSNLNTDDDAASDTDGNKSSSSLKSLSKGTPGAKKPKVKKGKSKKNIKDTIGTMGVELMVDGARQQIIPTLHEPDSAGDVDLTPVVGSAVRRFFDAEQLSIKSRSVVQENLRRLLAGLLVRSIRRISRSYLRQLWDENYQILATEDAEKELFFRSMLRLQKVLQVKTHMRSMLESSRLRLLKEFGAENKALEHLNNKSAAVGAEIASLEMDLRQAAERSGELAVTATAQPNGGCLQLGTLGLLLVESSWGWLGRDDQLLLPMVQEVEIHEQIQQQLEQMLVPTPPRIAQHLDDDAAPTPGPGASAGAGLDSSGGTAANPSAPTTRPASALSNYTESAGSDITATKPSLPVQAVLCVSTCPLLPHSSSLHSVSEENPSIKPTSLRGADTRTSPSFVLSTLDVRRVLQVLAKWQQESPDRAVLLSGPTGPSVDAAQGYAAPFAVTSNGQEITSDAQFDDPANVMLDVWNRDRSKLQQVLVGDLSRANRATAGYFQDLALLQAQSLDSDAFIKEFTVTDTGTQFKSYYDRATQCVRRCFWDVCFSPQLPPIATSESVTGVRAAPPASFVTDCVTDSRRGHVTFSLGPVVGGVTATSANVLVQVCDTAPLELICVDQVTGAEYLCSRLATAHRPCLFEFEHLLPNHAYDLIMLSCSGAQGGAADTQCVLWGSFTTHSMPRVLLPNTFSGAMSDANVVHSLRHMTGGGGGNGSLAGSLAASEEEHRGRSNNHANSSIRLLLLGADKPSWRGKLSHTSAGAMAGAGASLDRQNLSRGVGLCQEVGNCLAQGWGGVDLVVHCGLAVDWGASIDGVLNLLTQAETLQGLYTGALSNSNFAVQSNHLPIVFAPSQSNARPSAYQTHAQDTQHGPTAHSLLLQAFEILRSAYVKHWGASPHSSNLLAHGNHYFLSAPVFEILALFHATSLRDLRRDLSPYCVQHLTQFVAQLHLEYQQQLSCPAQSIMLYQQGDHTTASIPYLRLLDGGAVALFELQPNFAFQQDSFNRVSDHLLSTEQVQALDKLLFPNVPGMYDHASSSGPRTFAKDNLTTLVLLSPIPLVLDSDVMGEFSHLNAQHKGVRFAHREVLQLLDLLSQWVEVNPLEREVLIIAGGVATSFITTIHCEPIARPQGLKGGGRRTAATSAHSLPQEASVHSGGTQAPNRTPPAPPVKIRQMCCGALVGIQEDTLPLREGTLHSTERRFKFIHRTCANNTGAEVTVSTGETRPHTAATSGTAAAVAAAEAARLSEYFPQCGVVEILTTESRAQLQASVTPLSPLKTNILHEQHTLESPPPESVSSSPAVVPAPAVLKFLDQAGLKAYFSHGWPAQMGGTEAFTHNKISTGIKGDSSVALSLQGKFTDSGISERSFLQHSRIQGTPPLYHLATELQTLLFVNSVAQGPEQAYVAEIKRAMEAICQRERTLFEECHRIFLRHDTFPLPVNGNYNVEKCVLAMSHWVVTRMGAATRNVCKVPSSFVIRLVWEHYEREAEKLIKPSQDNSGRHVGENVVAEFVCASMSGDVDYFVRLLKNGIELQLIQEYMAYSRGLLDGAGR